jgi:hypothetical protein
MGFYSFVVIAPHPAGIIDPMVMLDTGVNAFSVVVDDLDAFVDQLKAEGVEIKNVNRLDEHAEVSEQHMLLAGEDLVSALTNGVVGDSKS